VTWTLGVSGSVGKFHFAGGFNRQSGSSNNLTIQLLNGRTVQSEMNVKLMGFIYSLAYQF